MKRTDFTPEQLVEMLHAVLPDVRTQLTAEHASGILQRIKYENLTPFEEGYSLHCWNAEYMIDGGHYSLTGEIGNSFPFSVELIQPRR